VIRHRIAQATTAATNHPVTHHLFALATTAATNHPVTHHLIALATTAATNHPVSFVHMALARIAALVIPILGVPLNVLPVETVVYHHRVMPVLSATVKLWVFAALVMTVFIVILSTKTAVNYHHAHAHRHLSPLLHQHLSHQHPSVTKSVTKNVIVIMDLRVVVKEEKVDITEDVIFNAPTISYSPTAITEAVTEEKVVVVKEAKVAITKTLATLSAKLSVNNKFQRMYSLCGLCVCIYDIYF